MQTIKPVLAVAIGFALLVIVIGQGCAGIGTAPSICETITEPSLLCDLSEKSGVRLEDIGNGLVIANAVAIGQGLYTKDQALKVMQEIRSILDNPVSYAFFKSGVYEKVKAYPGLIEVAEIYFEELGAKTQIMYRVDRDILTGWMDKQIKRLEE